jgi:hypothetical protein
MDRRLFLAVVLAGCRSSPAEPVPAADAGEEPVVPADAAHPDRSVDPPLLPDAGPPPPTPDAALPTARLDGPATPAAGWWDSHWTRRRAVTVTHPGKEALADFVVPVLLPAEAAGDDLRFVAGETILDHELERAAGQGPVAWVRVPRIPAGGVGFTAYYGSAGAPARPGQVWAAPHAGVWHFAGDARDASANHYDGAQAQVRFVPGTLGTAAAFDYASKEHVSLIANTKLVSGAGAVTVSAWVQHAGPVHDGQDIILGIGTASTTGHLSRVSVAISPELGLIGEANPDEGAWDVIGSPASSVPNSQWHHLAVVIDVPAKTILLYKDGVPLRAPFKGRWTASAYAATPANRVTVGCEEDESKSFFSGLIDELRVDAAARSPEWLAAEARAGKMATVGPEEMAP